MTNLRAVVSLVRVANTGRRKPKTGRSLRAALLAGDNPVGRPVGLAARRRAS